MFSYYNIEAIFLAFAILKKITVAERDKHSQSLLSVSQNL